MKPIVFAIVCLASSVSGQADTSAAAVGAGYALPTPVNVAPGQVITFFVHGIGSGLKGPVAAGSLPLPTSLAGISASYQVVDSIPLPILGVAPVSTCEGLYLTKPGCGSSYTAVMVQIPFHIPANNPTVHTLSDVNPGLVSFAENGVVSASILVLPFVDQVHILRDCGGWPLNLPPPETSCPPAVSHADGSKLAFGTAKAGEEIAIYAVGLGDAGSFSATGDAPSVPVLTSSFRVSFDPRPNALASRPSAAGENGPNTAAPDFMGLIPGYVGLYQVNVKVPALPADAERCEPNMSIPHYGRVLSNMTINIFGPASVDGVGICVEPGL